MMTRYKSILLAGLLPLLSSAAIADWSGNIAVEARYFTSSPQWQAQGSEGVSVSLQPEYRHQWNDGMNGFTFIPFVRLDSMDDERTHADIRELSYLHVMDGWEFRAGISKVFWGVTESQHLVDIINQTDLVESIDGEEKLGQPMVRVTRVLDAGSIDVFLMPWFRERTFPGIDGRFRTPLPVDTGSVAYESDDEQRHFDYSLRWNGYLGNVDYALSWFDGTSREPGFIAHPDKPLELLAPYYYQLQQAGLELQYTGEAWLWKLEAVHRHTSLEDYWAATGGFEYTFVGINDSALDLGVIGEYLYDSRGTDGLAPFQNDLFVGARLTLNDAQSSELLAGAVVDLDHSSKTFRVEASRRIGQSYKLSVEAQLFADVDVNDPLSAFEEDSFVQVELARYF